MNRRGFLRTTAIAAGVAAVLPIAKLVPIDPPTETEPAFVMRTRWLTREQVEREFGTMPTYRVLVMGKDRMHSIALPQGSFGWVPGDDEALDARIYALTRGEDHV